MKKRENSKFKNIFKKGKLLMNSNKIIIIFLCIIMSISLIASIKKQKNVITVSRELARMMEYEQFKEKDSDIKGTNNVKFSAFFLRDLDNDGYTEKIKGTCKEIGKEDTLYMEINVQTEGYLKDAKIEIQGQNFYFKTAIPKDEQLKSNIIGNNIKQIEFSQLNNGTQKLLTGTIRSGDYTYNDRINRAINDNVNNYTRDDNKVILTGIYVDDNGNETQIRKEIDLIVDWYGTIDASILEFYKRIDNYEALIKDDILTFSLDILTSDTKKQLNLSKNYVEIDIPKINEKLPLNVEVEDNSVEFLYDNPNGKLTFERKAQVDDNGNIIKKLSDTNNYNIKISYDISNYKLDDIWSLKIPVKTYYEGYNNKNEQFENPYKSKEIKENIIMNFYKNENGNTLVALNVGEYLGGELERYIVSKEGLINELDGIVYNEELNKYKVNWKVLTNEESKKIILSEE